MTDEEKDRIMKMMPELKNYRTINEIAEVASKFLDKYEIVDKDVVSGEDAKEKIDYIKQVMKKVNYKDFQNSFKEILTADGKKLKDYYPVLRTMLIGVQHGIGVHKMIELIGENWVKDRINKFKL
jgi:glutamyl/glutaminyl-tRNA synthetase